MTLRRGFKAEANRHSVNIRRRLGLAAHEALCPWRLSADLCVPIVTLSELAQEHPGVSYFLTRRGMWEFSAGSFFLKGRTLIVVNDSHTRGRQASDISHEVSHILLGHQPARPVNPFGLREYDPELEEEANWLGPAILISDEAAVYIARRGWGLAYASEIYGVTEEVLRYRLNVTAAFRRAG